MTNESGPRVAVLTVDPPWPPISGADLRNWRTAESASKLGPVTLISVRGGALDATETVPHVALRTLSDEPPDSIYRRPEGGSHLDLTVSDRIRQDFAASFDRTTSVLIVTHPGLCQMLADIRKPGLKLILDLHNIESDLFRQSQSWWSRLVRSYRSARVVRTERSAIAAVDELWVCSAADAARIEQLYGPDLPVRIVPNSIPPMSEAYCMLSPAPRRPNGPNLLFLGHLGYRPNIEAARILARNLMPRIARRFAGAHLKIAGREPDIRVKALAAERVGIVANPPDVTPLYDEADLVVVPLRVGGGTRIKIIEAMARGVPVVATRRAAEGLGVTDGAEIRLAETPGEFVAAIAELWRDKRVCEAQRRQAHALVWRSFAPQRIEAAIIDGIAAGHKATSTP